jgi:hypothetical protein
MASGEGSRTEAFVEGHRAAGFKATSVLDNVKPSGVGYGDTDKDRLLVGSGDQKLASKNGSSAKTWESRQKGWLDSPYRTFG